MRFFLTAALLLFASAAVAQQQPQTVQEQLYTACGNTNSQLAKMLDAGNARLVQLSEELAKAQARVKELESEKAKQEEKK